MSGEPEFTPSPGNEARGDIHYLVFSPHTPPLGLETDNLLTSAFAAFAAGTSNSLDLILRVSDPDQIHRDPDVDYWLKLRIYPDRSTFRQTGSLEASFNGPAYKLEPDGTESTHYVCAATMQFIDQPAGTRIGELVLTTGGTT